MGSDANLPPGWQVGRLGDLAVKVGSGATPRGGREAYLPDRQTFALIRSQNVKDGHFDPDGLAFIKDADAKKLKNVHLQPDDILLNITGDGVTFGRACRAPSHVFPCVVNQHVCIVRCGTGLVPGYLLAFLRLPTTRSYIESFNAGGSRRAITKGHIESFELPIPPLAVQRRIAAVLGALDDKIEVNRRMSQTLEEMAQAVFKSWFVDFDGHGSSELVDSELGAIPRGWSVCALGDLLQLKRGYDLPKRERIEGDVPIVSSSGVSGTHNEAKVEAPGVVVGRYGTIGQVFFVEDDFWPLNTSLYVRDFKGSPQRFIFHLLRGVNWHAYTGKSAVPGVNRNHVHRERIVCPPVTRRTQFDAAVAPLWQRHSANERASQTLAELRDTLLPKLISGEIRVPEAEAAVEAAL